MKVIDIIDLMSPPSVQNNVIHIMECNVTRMKMIDIIDCIVSTIYTDEGD